MLGSLWSLLLFSKEMFGYILAVIILLKEAFRRIWCLLFFSFVSLEVLVILTAVLTGTVWSIPFTRPVTSGYWEFISSPTTRLVFVLLLLSPTKLELNWLLLPVMLVIFGQSGSLEFIPVARL